MDGAAQFVAKVSMFGAVNVGKVLPLAGSEDLEFVHCIRGRLKEGREVEMRGRRSFWFRTEFGASATQFD